MATSEPQDLTAKTSTEKLLAAAEAVHDMIRWMSEVYFWTCGNEERIQDVLESLAQAIRLVKDDSK